MSTLERNVKGLLGTKLGMTQFWDENNLVVPVTVGRGRDNGVGDVPVVGREQPGPTRHR